MTAAQNGKTKAEWLALYVALGWRLVLLRGQTKVPVHERWQDSASADPDTVAGWARRRPGYNVGLLLGPASGVIDLECDDPGAETELVLLLGEELAWSVPRYRSARGVHRLFAWGPGLPRPDNAVFHWKGIEFRVGGGNKGAQSVLPPSIHPSGAAYEWQVPPGAGPLVPLPPEVVAKIAAEPGQGGGGGERVEEDGVLGPGQRHPALLHLAGVLRAKGLAPAEIYAALVAINRRRCRPPKPDEELRKIAEWFEAREGEPWGLNPPRLVRPGRGGGGGAGPLPGLPPPADFPAEALPPVLAEYVVQTAAAMGCAAPYVALPTLAAAFGCVGNTRRVLVRRRWEEPAVGWFALVGESGTLKTPAQAEALAPLRRVAARLAREHREALRGFAWEREKYQRARAQALKKGKEMPLEPERPPDTRVLVSDVTIERLAVLLADNPRGLLLERDELAGWVGSFTRYGGKDVASGDLPHWLSIFNARPITVDRKTGDRPSVHVPAAAVSLIGGIQPGIWRRVMAAAHWDSGLVARLLPSWPAERKKAWTDAEAGAACVEAYEELLGKLLATPMPHDEDGPAPFVVKMTADAHEAWVEFYGEWAERQSAADGEPRAMLSKLEGYCARLALVHHVVSRVSAGQDDCDPVEVGSVKAAMTLTRWFADESERAYCRFSEDAALAGRRRLVEFIRSRDDQITPRVLQKSNRARYPTIVAAAAALDVLVNAGLGCWDVLATGGRPSKVFRLAPEPPPDPEE
jgi:hypothetical protein